MTSPRYLSRSGDAAALAAALARLVDDKAARARIAAAGHHFGGEQLVGILPLAFSLAREGAAILAAHMGTHLLVQAGRQGRAGRPAAARCRWPATVPA